MMPAHRDSAVVLIGREQLVAELVEYSDRDHATCVLVGPPGIGKTAIAVTVAAALGRRAGADRPYVVEIWASAALGEIPFGALAAHISVGESTAITSDDGVELVADCVASAALGRPLALVVDDWQLLDKSSVAVIDRLVERGGAALLATLRTDEVSGAAETEVRARQWRIVELPVLNREETTRMAAEILQGRLSEPAAAELWRRSGGNPLFVRELVVHGMERGALGNHGGVWTFAGPLDVPVRVSDMIGLRLAGLSPDHRDAVVLVAVAGALPVAMADSLIGPAALAELLRTGWFRTDARKDSNVVSVGHPLVDDAIRSSISPVQLVTTSQRLADAADASAVRPDVLQVARWNTVGGRAASSRLWLSAARRARALGQLGLAEQFAESAVAASPSGFAERLAHVEIVTTAGDFRRAEHLAAAVQADMTSAVDTMSAGADPGNLDLFCLVAICRAFNAYWGVGDLATAGSALDTAGHTLDELPPSSRVRCRPARLELEAERAVQLAFSGRMAEGLQRANDVLDQAADDARVTTRARWGAGIALMQLGRPVDAATHLRSGLESVDRMQTYGRDQFTTFLTSSLALALIECADAVTALDVATEGVRRASAGHDVTRRSLAGFALGRAALARGHVDAAVHAFSDAATADLVYRSAGRASWSVVGLARAEALRGAVDRANELIAASTSLPRSDDRFWHGEHDRALGWAKLAAAEWGEGIAALERGYTVASREGHHAMAAWLAHDLLRVRGDRHDVEQVLTATATLDQGVFPLLRDHARALRHGPDDLRRCAESFAGGGFDLIAAEISFTAADRLRRAGSRSEAARATVRGDELLATCGPVHTPALGLRFDIEGVTRRQRQILHLAACGLTNSEIATQLALSIRTVGNQLQRVYETTGLTRAELPKLA